MYLDRETIVTTPRQAEPNQSAPALANKPGEPVKPAVDEAAPFAASAAEALEASADKRVKERVRQVIPLEAEPKATGMFGKLDWKHYTAVAVVLMALVGGSLALVNRNKGEAAQPAATTQTQTPPDQNAAQPADQAAPPPPQQNTQPPEQAQSNTSAKDKKKPSKKEAKKEAKKGFLDRVIDTAEKVKKVIPKKKEN
jgi:hypothetical protein